MPRLTVWPGRLPERPESSGLPREKQTMKARRTNLQVQSTVRTIQLTTSNLSPVLVNLCHYHFQLLLNPLLYPRKKKQWDLTCFRKEYSWPVVVAFHGCGSSTFSTTMVSKHREMILLRILPIKDSLMPTNVRAILIVVILVANVNAVGWFFAEVSMLFVGIIEEYIWHVRFWLMFQLCSTPTTIYNRLSRGTNNNVTTANSRGSKVLGFQMPDRSLRRLWLLVGLDYCGTSSETPASREPLYPITRRWRMDGLVNTERKASKQFTEWRRSTDKPTLLYNY